MVVYLFVVIQIYNKFSGFLLLFILLSAKTSSLACMCMHTRAREWRSFSGQQYLNSLNCNGFKPTFCVYRTTIILFHPFNPFNPCSFTTEFFSNTDLSDWRGCLVVGRYCLPDSCHCMLYKSRDFVPGYSRFARYWLPARSPLLVPLWERLTVIRLGSNPVPAAFWSGHRQKKHPQKRMLLNNWVIRLGLEPRIHCVLVGAYIQKSVLLWERF